MNLLFNTITHYHTHYCHTDSVLLEDFAPPPTAGGGGAGAAASASAAGGGASGGNGNEDFTR